MPEDTELSRLYDTHATSLFGYLLNLTRSEPETRDLLQSLFCRLARKPELLAGARSERALLLRMAHNLFVDQVRSSDAYRRQVEILTKESAGLFASSPDPDQTTFRNALGVALADLPTNQRAVVHLKLWEGLTFEAIAMILDLRPNTAASRYRYGLDKLRHQLRPLYNEIQ